MSEGPYCGNPINEEQIICLKCGRQLQPLKVENVKKKRMKICIILIATLIIVMLLITTLPMLFA